MSVTMQALPNFLGESPRWQRDAKPRFAVCLCVATLLVALALAALRFPAVQVLRPGPEILIRLLPAVIEPIAEVPPVIDEQPESGLVSPPTPAETESAPDASPRAGTTGVADTVTQPTDWYGHIPEAAKAAVDEMERIVSVNPIMDEKRHKAKEKFYVSLAPEQKEIWDNVETRRH